jgi:hypothetical protein
VSIRRFALAGVIAVISTFAFANAASAWSRTSVAEARCEQRFADFSPVETGVRFTSAAACVTFVRDGGDVFDGSLVRKMEGARFGSGASLRWTHTAGHLGIIMVGLFEGEGYAPNSPTTVTGHHSLAWASPLTDAHGELGGIGLVSCANGSITVSDAAGNSATLLPDSTCTSGGGFLGFLD